MADYYTHFSCILDLPDSESAARAIALYEDFAARLEINEGVTPGFEISAEPENKLTHLWIRDAGGYGDADHVLGFVEQLAPLVGLTGLWGFEWAHTCSKPRPEAFGGGAQIIDLATGETQAMVSTNEWLTRLLNNTAALKHEETHEPTEPVLEDGDYVAPDGLWLTVRNASLRISPHDEGLGIAVYRTGQEFNESVTETWATWAELELADDPNNQIEG